MKFEVPGRPQGKARPRVTKKGTYTPQRTRDYERLIRTSYIAAGGRQYTKDVPVRVNIRAYYAIPKGTSKRKQEKMIAGDVKPTVKPDCDNIAKVVCDALNGLAYADDNRVVVLTVTKLYGENPRLMVEIESI